MTRAFDLAGTVLVSLFAIVIVGACIIVFGFLILAVLGAGA